VSDTSRIDDLRRRVHKDPASIAFAQLGEELRRNGDYQESIEVCRAGLALHPGYLSARVTLARALLELEQLDDAQAELTRVLKSAPENLAALRALAETRQRQGSDADALASYRSALLLAKNDSFLQQAVDDLSRKVEPEQPAADEPPPAPATEFSYANAAQDLPLQTPPEPVTVFSYAEPIEDLPLHAPSSWSQFPRPSRPSRPSRTSRRSRPSRISRPLGPSSTSSTSRPSRMS
jgi:tetratricopeptide (TPR) repeat protein